MRIIIKEPEAKRGFRLILPYHMMINLCVRKSWVKMGLKGKRGKGDSEGDKGSEKSKTQRDDEKIMAFVEALDFGELREALHGLSVKSGIVLVEVSSSDGTFVQIMT